MASKKIKYSVPNSLQSIKNKLIDRLLFGIFIIALIGTPVSVMRSVSTGWLNLYTFHLSVAIVVVVFYYFSKKISFHIKSLFLLSMFYFVGILGLFTLGVLGSGFWWMIVCCFLVSSLYSLRLGIYAVIVSTCIIIFAGYCFSNEIITMPVEANSYVKNFSSWVSLIIATTVMPFLVFQALASFQSSTMSLLKEVDRQKHQIEEMATHDQLTGLLLMNEANEKFADSLQEAERAGTKVAVLFIDLDGFKAVNDEYGHDAGDQILIQVAHRLRISVSDEDIVSRIGGDEFLVILTQVESVDWIKKQAQILINQVGKPYDYSGNEITIGASIGISLFPDDAKNPKNLKKLADKAMYSVKHSGKNGFGFVNQ